ncbi:putative bifunctional diguanylate cyclase/phosphodiesterase [Thiohalophilus thiocyanatoxydans]|uniref:Diguanylate cyclase (GGDEF)-like protein n=1 Tax=Thiohalophilus thiocyanatoxydans TaxID=381308 RepID=A0A4V3H4T4_9GAMM|nr:EAL domain-containing protein [Thiohalophilus thiocyanatoxydans]TDY04355.1 diguanylate cyclase (GGDEF)-like protein [Thiohalophilus thiocyanatoxydans]
MSTLTEATKYTIYGTLFGLCFPVGAIIFLYLMGDIPADLNPVSILANSHENRLLYIIDTAPFLLGLFARFAGIRQDRLLRFSASLEQQVAAKTASLRQALDEAKQANDMIVHMAEHDTLTGLLNRRRFQNELEKWMLVALRYQRTATLIFIDLDKFKYINDNYGHIAGDRYLIEISKLLTSTFRTTDIVARWGGDEFAILLPETSCDAATEVANKLLHLFNNAEIDLGEQKWRPSASIGIALFPDHATDLDELVTYADAAMYEAKSAGGNCWRIYSSSPQEIERVQEHLQWEGRLRRALENDQFLLFYQPLLRLSDNTTPGYEALLRMEDRDGNLISPGLFLASAERFGLSVPIDRMVIRKAARKIGALSQHPVWISLNLSRSSLEDPKLFEKIEAAVRENSLRPGQLHIEITEATAREYLNPLRTLISQLKSIGCSVVLDDFGHGPSRQFLQQLPVDMIKIKGDLIQTLASQQSTQTLVEDIVAVAHEMAIRVTAKHVESENLLELLRDKKFDYAQGFAIGKPVEAIEQQLLFSA